GNADIARPLQPILDSMARRLLAIAALFTPLFLIARILPVVYGGDSPYLWVQTSLAIGVIAFVLIAAWYRSRLTAKQIGYVMAMAAALVGLLAVTRSGINTVQSAWLLISCLIIAVFIGRKLALFAGISMWLYAWLAGLFHSREQFGDLELLLDEQTGLFGSGSGLGLGLLAVLMVSDIVPRLLAAIEALFVEKTREQERRWIAEAHSAEIETRWMRYFDYSAVGITLLDDSGRVVGWSKKNEQYLGMTSEQMQGRSIEDYLRSLDVNHPLLEKVAGLYQSIPFTDFMLEIPTEFGVKTILLLADPLFDEHGAIAGAFMAGLDVTALVSRDSGVGEEPLLLGRQDARAAMSNKLLGIRSSLLAAGVTAEGLTAELSSANPHIDVLAASAQRLIEQQQSAAVLADEAFSFINDKPRGAAIQDAARLAETAAAILRARCEKANINLELDDAFAEGAEVKVQPVLLRQILVNLMSNAREAIERSTKATARDIRVKILAEAGSVVFMVEDTAGGVVPVNPDVYFNPSFSTKGEVEDSGKGLYVSRHTAERLGGSLDVEQGESGLRFVLTLPRASEDDDE
ncbi:MAG: ATP-binding protein, partial [Halieaceae bacterium]|nr:ATP-binding protein [Halieaceae bacterium]